jgi:nitrous oxidase accessory protein
VEKIMKIILIGFLCFGLLFGTLAQANAGGVDSRLGDILYVGGNGQGNYSRIQEALDAAHPGDTVFVFDDSSPYVEALAIDTSLALVGENQESTILTGTSDYNIVINADNVTVSGFTCQENWVSNGIILQNCSRVCVRDMAICNADRGIVLEHATRALIEDNIISCNYSFLIVWSSKNIIRNNTMNGLDGMQLNGGYGNIIQNNTINTSYGIDLTLTMFFDCASNHFNRCRFSVSCETTVYGKIRDNIFQDCEYGVFFTMTWGSRIVSNTFLNTTTPADFETAPFSYWRHNYWNEPRLLPKSIHGSIFLVFGFYLFFEIPTFKIDWHPALTPPTTEN